MPAPAVSILESGPVFLGCLGHWMLFGAYMVQLYDYYMTYHANDKKFIKFVVYIVSIGGVLQTVIETYTLWALLITGWGIPEAFQQTPTLSPGVPPLSGIVSATVQIFFAWRIWSLKSTSKPACIIALLIVIISFTQCAGSIVVGVQYAASGRDPEVLHKIKAGVEVWLIGSFICDLLISSTMLTLLLRARMESSFKSTTRMINRLIIVTIETGTVTVIVVCIQLIVYLKFPQDYIHLALMYILLSVYSNVLLATLNGRERARQYANDVEYSIDITSSPRMVTRPVSTHTKRSSRWRGSSDVNWLKPSGEQFPRSAFTRPVISTTQPRRSARSSILSLGTPLSGMTFVNPHLGPTSPPPPPSPITDASNLFDPSYCISSAERSSDSPV